MARSWEFDPKMRSQRVPVHFTAPLAPTLDGLGAPGDGAHASHEHVRLDRWPDHVRLLTRLLKEI